MGRRIMLALGGNAILPHGKTGTVEEQREITARSLEPVAAALKPEDRLVITHGNGPIVGNILIRNAAVAAEIPPMPIDVCDADSQGGVGYMIVQSMDNAFRDLGRPRPVVGMLTRILVDANDPALTRPTKPIGPFYSEARARAEAEVNGWVVKEDAGRGWRRVIGSPKPLAVLELDSIRTLFEAGTVVVAAGGGGIPVAHGPGGAYIGVEAVIDKDRASVLLAGLLDIETLVIITGVTHVAVNFGKKSQRNLDRITAAEARAFYDAGEFGEGSMKPKMEAALTFLEKGGKEVRITSPEEIGAALEGTSGTLIEP